jgi:transposase
MARLRSPKPVCNKTLRLLIYRNSGCGRRETRRRLPRDVAECDAQGAFGAKVALSHGINANIVRGRRRRVWQGQAIAAPLPQFVPVSVATTSQMAEPRGIKVEFRRGAPTIRLTWPLGATSDLANRMREILR